MENLPVHAVLHLCRQEDLQCVIGLAGLVEEILDLGPHGGGRGRAAAEVFSSCCRALHPCCIAAEFGLSLQASLRRGARPAGGQRSKSLPTPPPTTSNKRHQDQDQGQQLLLYSLLEQPREASTR